MPSVTGACGTDGRGLDDLSALVGDRLIEDPAKISREKAPLREPAPVASRGLECPCEMIRLTSEGAHAIGTHV